jgi:hypothetical protein
MGQVPPNHRRLFARVQPAVCVRAELKIVDDEGKVLNPDSDRSIVSLNPVSIVGAAPRWQSVR